MKHLLRKNEGMTLVEFVISIAIGSIVMLAATGVLLLGLRIHARSVEVSNQQYTVSILMNVIHDMISEGDVTNIEKSTESGTGEYTWTFIDVETGETAVSTTRLTYNSLTQTLFLGKDSPILDGVISFDVMSQKKDGEGKSILITIAMTTDNGGPYAYTIYAPSGIIFDQNETT